MPKLPQRETLVTQLTTILRREIARGAWRDWLPSERALSDALQVSRNTLRTALKQLHREKIIRPVHGSGNRILGAPPVEKAAVRSRDIAILSPDPVERLRPNFTLWIDRLRMLCETKGFRLHLLHGRQYFRANPGPTLHKLLRQQPHGCWILILSSESTQRWFEVNREACVVAGTVYTGIDLPYCAQDHRAMCRRAVGKMLVLGHRKVALLIRRARLAADLESEAGFTAAMAESGVRGAEAIVIRHDDTAGGVCQQVRQLMRQNPPPTALIVTNALYHLTVTGCLQQLGRRVPRDVSVISRTDDPFLDFVMPSPTRYASRPAEMAKGLLSLVQPLLAGEEPAPRVVRIPPRYIAGTSLGRAQ